MLATMGSRDSLNLFPIRLSKSVEEAEDEAGRANEPLPDATRPAIKASGIAPIS